MAEPKNKKIKMDEDNSTNKVLNPLLNKYSFPRNWVEEIHKNLPKKCLCMMKISVIRNLLINCNISLHKYSKIKCNHEEILLYTGMLSTFFEIAVKQGQEKYCCTVIADLVNMAAANERDLANNLIFLLESDNKYISYSAGRTISSFLLILNGSKSHKILQRLVKNICISKSSLLKSHSFNIIQNVINWKAIDEHPLNQNDNTFDQCRLIPSSQADMNNPENVKISAIKTLEAMWVTLIESMCLKIKSYYGESEHVFISFIHLWETILSIKANLPVDNLTAFHNGLHKLITLLVENDSRAIWRSILDLYNEALCYGSTLALQNGLVDISNLPKNIIYAIKNMNILNTMPSDKDLGRNESEIMIDIADQSIDKILLRKLVLLAFKSVAMTINNFQYDSSSDDSSNFEDLDGSQSGDNIIQHNSYETLNTVDEVVKKKIYFSPETSIAEWIVPMFVDHDDWLIESMLCSLDIYSGLSQTSRLTSTLEKQLDPHETFIKFCDAVHFDHDVFLDFLISNETCFLLYLLRYLKFLKRYWSSFLKQDERYRIKVITTFIKLRLAIERLVSKNLFPYNITPILKLLDHCEELYEESG